MALRDRIAALLGISTYQSPSGFGPDLEDESVKEVRKQLSGQIQPLPVTRLRWYLADLEEAQAAADSGNLRPAAQLYRAMRRDGVLAGLFSTRASGLVALPKRFYGDEKMVEALRADNGTRSVFDEMLPPQELALMVADGFTLGVSVGELLPVVGRSYPVLVRLEPEFLQYRWNENRWYFLSIAGALPITPGDGRWVLHVPGARMSPWHFGLWPALGRAFINKEHAMLHRSNFSAKLANPARAATAPVGASMGERLGFLQKLIQWGTNTTFELPPGWDVKLIESNGMGRQVFQEEINTSDNEYTVAIAGQLVTTTGGTGFANADIHAKIRQDLIDGDGDALAYTVNTQILPSYILANGGAGSLESRWASVKWDTSTPKELEAEANTFQKLAQGLAQLAAVLKGTGRDINVDEIATRFGIPLSTNKVAGDSTVPAVELGGEMAPPPGTPKPPGAGNGAKALAHWRHPNASDFKESDHPRDKDGEFGSGGGGGGSEPKEEKKQEKGEVAKDSESYFKSDPAKLASLKHYTADRGYKTINSSLRAGKPTPEAEKFLDIIKSAPKAPGTAVRGLTLGPQQAARFKVGARLTAEGMWSSTTEKQVAAKFNKIEKIPGAKPKVPVTLYIEHKSGVDVSKLSKFPAEKEVIIPHGVSLTVSKVEHRGKSVQVYLKEE